MVERVAAFARTRVCTKPAFWRMRLQDVSPAHTISTNPHSGECGYKTFPRTHDFNQPAFWRMRLQDVSPQILLEHAAHG
jgi:hypothetical protein